MHIIAAKAVAFKEVLQPEFKVYAKQVVQNARVLADKLLNLGYDISSGGTDNHLILLDLRSHKLTGKDAEAGLEEAGITTNKNMVPFDPESPFVTSGIRIGTAALTTRGMKENEMNEIAFLMDTVLNNLDNKKVSSNVREQVQDLCKRFPLYSF